MEFIGFEDITSCRDDGLDSWTLPDSRMAFSLLVYTRFFPNFPPLGAGSGPAVDSGAVDLGYVRLSGTTMHSGAGSVRLSGTAMPFVPLSGPNVIFGSTRVSSSSRTFSP